MRTLLTALLAVLLIAPASAQTVHDACVIDGQIVAVGDFTDAQGQSRSHLAIYSLDGTLVRAGHALDAPGHQIISALKGLVLGDFGQVDGKAADGLATLSGAASGRPVPDWIAQLFPSPSGVERVASGANGQIWFAGELGDLGDVVRASPGQMQWSRNLFFSSVADLHGVVGSPDEIWIAGEGAPGCPDWGDTPGSGSVHKLVHWSNGWKIGHLPRRIDAIAPFHDASGIWVGSTARDGRAVVGFASPGGPAAPRSIQLSRQVHGARGKVRDLCFTSQRLLVVQENALGGGVVGPNDIDAKLVAYTASGDNLRRDWSASELTGNVVGVTTFMEGRTLRGLAFGSGLDGRRNGARLAVVDLDSGAVLRWIP